MIELSERVTSGSLAIREATGADDSSICSLLRDVPMSRGMEIVLESEPSYFAALQLEGVNPLVAVIEQDERIVGVGAAVERSTFVNGVPCRTGYLSSLRLAPEVRGTTALVRGYRFLQQRLAERRNVNCWLTSIMQSNRVARDILASNRGVLPNYRKVGAFETHVLPVRRKRVGSIPEIEIRRGDQIGEMELQSFLLTEGVRRQFFPVFSDGKPDLLPSLKVSDMLIACKGRTVLGTLGLWDTGAYRQQAIRAYSGLWRLLRPSLNLAARMSGYAPLPVPGKHLRVLFAAATRVGRDDTRVLHALLEAARQVAAERNFDFLILGLAANDPLRFALRGIPRISIASDIFTVDIAGYGPDVPELDNRPLHMETGAL